MHCDARSNLGALCWPFGNCPWDPLRIPRPPRKVAVIGADRENEEFLFPYAAAARICHRRHHLATVSVEAEASCSIWLAKARGEQRAIVDGDEKAKAQQCSSIAGGE